MSDELYKEYRPDDWSGIVGQPEAVATLKQLLGSEAGLPHAILLSGPSGCGKTTIARILKDKLGCNPKLDYMEINGAESRGIDDIRQIAGTMRGSAVGGTCRVYVIDEAHKLTNDAQNALLKPLEDTPSHVYFILCTTEPNKLIKTILSRCTEVKVREVGKAELQNLLVRTCLAAGISNEPELIAKIATVAEGCPRKALVLLNQVRHIEDHDARMAAVEAGDHRAVAIDLARALFNVKSDWAAVSAILRGIDFTKEDIEGLRHMILGYATSVLIKGANARAFLMIDCFGKNFYDSKKAGLVAACYEVINAK